MRDSWLVKELSKFVDFYPICPEMEMGLGTPREEMHLYYKSRDNKEIRIKTKYSNLDLTERAKETYSRINKELRSLEIDGFILTKKSPSCAIDRINASLEINPQSKKLSVGLFAQNLKDNFPSIPIVDNGRLHDLKLRENFIKSVFAHFRFKDIDKKVSSLQMFHQRYKYILMDHSAQDFKLLGTIASQTSQSNYNDSIKEYYQLLFQILRIGPTLKTRHNTLQHLMGYFKKFITKEEKQNLVNLLDDCKDGILNHLVAQKHFELLSRKYDVTYLNNQYYFSPYPKELKLQKGI
jgi:uncharacterized protein YbgA (DUF1722 family)/uncharacterized protein YbbK (DUF523 family)